MDNVPVKASGDQLTALEYNNSPQELKDVVTSSGQSLGGGPGNQIQIAKAMAIYSATSDFYTDSGLADAYVLNVISPRRGPIAYILGMRVRFSPGNTNTTASTINVNSLGVKNIKDVGGNDVAAGEILAGGAVELFYDGTNFVLVDSSAFTLPFSDSLALMANAADPTKLIGFDGSNIATGTRRDIIVPDRNVDLRYFGLQKVITEYITYLTGADVRIPFDDTIPQITEGHEFMIAAITPIRADTSILIEIQGFFSLNGSADEVVFAVFQDSIADALFATSNGFFTANATAAISFKFVVPSASLVARTYRLKSGSASAGRTISMNGQNTTRKFGGVSISSIILTEFI